MYPTVRFVFSSYIVLRILISHLRPQISAYVRALSWKVGTYIGNFQSCLPRLKLAGVLMPTLYVVRVEQNKPHNRNYTRV